MIRPGVELLAPVAKTIRMTGRAVLAPGPVSWLWSCQEVRPASGGCDDQA
jgi:hypothetical protein